MDQAKALTEELAEVKRDRYTESKETADALEEAELTLVKLHHLQEELDNVFLADQIKQKQLEELEQKESAKAAESEKEKEEAKEEAELALLQLNQVQEELDHYLLENKSSTELAKAQGVQLARCRRLLCELSQQEYLDLPSIKAINVEVLPPDNFQQTSGGLVQTEALLQSYKTSLRRAKDLLRQSSGA